MLLLLSAAAALGNATVSLGACPAGVAGTCVHYSGSGDEFDAYDYTQGPGFVSLTPVRFNDTPGGQLGASISPSGGCSAGATAGSARCPLPLAGIVIDAKGGDDWLAKHLNCGDACGRVFADMGEGNDLLRGSHSADRVSGGGGNDFLAGYDGDDTLDGGPGDDTFDPAPGADDVLGGPGYDTIVYYRSAGEPVTVTLDDQADDGIAGEADNVHRDVEDVTGGDGNDLLIGNIEANVLHGDLSGDAAAGADRIDGGGGADSLFGDGGNDAMKARDGIADTVDCGSGIDTAVTDTIDLVRNCENVDASKELEPDSDGDGVPKPTDCNDTNAAISPTAIDLPDNGVDENCDGRDAINLDRDRDGYNRPQDCNDNNRTIHPAARDIPGNRVDEDCSGTAAPFPQLTSTIGFDYRVTRRGIVLTRLYIARASAGSSLRVRCRGRGCSFRIKRLKINRARQRYDITRLARRTKLHPRTSLEFRITKPQTIGYFARLSVHKRALRRKEQCIRPGAAKPSACPPT